MKKQKKARELLPPSNEEVQFETTFRGKYRGLCLFLICCALLIAAFAISSVWMQGEGNGWLGNANETDTHKDPDEKDATGEIADGEQTNKNQDEIEEIPAHAMPIVEKDLSCLELGDRYIHNETAYAPDVQSLQEKVLSVANGQPPTVLILHTHTSEGYLQPDTSYVTEPLGELTYTRNEQENVIAVGRALAEALEKKGITAIHCTVMHDASGLSGAYERSAETVKKYMEQYPEICLVIDLHRDAVISSDGEAVSAVTEIDGERVAQVMAVVGSDGNGTPHDRWQDNLSLALQLRSELNKQGNLCRPVSLRNASFYQELAPFALLLEIGTSAGTVGQAIAAAELVGDAIARMLY